MGYFFKNEFLYSIVTFVIFMAFMLVNPNIRSHFVGYVASLEFKIDMRIDYTHECFEFQPNDSAQILLDILSTTDFFKLDTLLCKLNDLNLHELLLTDFQYVDSKDDPLSGNCRRTVVISDYSSEIFGSPLKTAFLFLFSNKIVYNLSKRHKLAKYPQIESLFNQFANLFDSMISDFNALKKSSEVVGSFAKISQHMRNSCNLNVLSHSKTSDTSSQNKEMDSQNEKSHSKTNDTGSKNNITYSQNERSHSNTNDTGSKNNITYSQNERSHSNTNDTGSKNNLTHSHNNFTLSKTNKAGSKNNLTHSQTDISHSKNTYKSSQNNFTHSKNNLSNSKNNLAHSQTKLSHIELQTPSENETLPPFTNQTNPNANTALKVVTRFPPEPSGFLHLGHAKAILINYNLASANKGSMILRFDDTNPTNESKVFVDAILSDLASILSIYPSRISFTSDYFPVLLDYARVLIKGGHAYCDCTTPEEISKQRFNGLESACRGTDPLENLQIFESMVLGNKQNYCLRAKIDYKHLNKALRDPVLYRHIAIPHFKTGTLFKIYPCYDFCCPIVDSIEGVTHAFRTNEYRDRNACYNWILTTLNLKNKPVIKDFSKLGFENTVLSKRKLRAVFESEGVGYDDPRMPTLRGIVKLGLSPEVLKSYVSRQGMKQKNAIASWDKIWAENKLFYEKTAKRYTGIEASAVISFEIANYHDLIADLEEKGLVSQCDSIKIEDHLQNLSCKDNESNGHSFEGVCGSLTAKHQSINQKSSVEGESPSAINYNLSLGNNNPSLGNNNLSSGNNNLSSGNYNPSYGNLNISVPINRRNPEEGFKTISLSKNLFIPNEKFNEDEEITLMNLGNFKIIKNALLFIKNGNYKNTKHKVQWINQKNHSKIKYCEYGNLFLENGDFNKNSKKCGEFICEKGIEKINYQEVVQLERIGFFYNDNGVLNLIPNTKQARKK